MSTALATQRDNNMDRYMAEVSRHALLSRESEQNLAKRFFDHGDVEAARQLVVANLRFVVKIAHEYRGYGMKLLDLVQEGNIGLMVAVKKFNPHKGYRLISYAVWWVRAYIQSFIMRSWSLVRLGAGRIHRKLFFKLRSARSRAEQAAQSDAPQTTQELAELLGVKEADIVDMNGRLAARDFSLDAQLTENSAATHLDMLPTPVASAEEAVGDKERQALLREKVDRTMKTLNEKERRIVEGRLLSDEPETLQEIGDAFQVSRERVRQLEARVMSKLRTALGAEATAPAAGQC